MDGGARVRRGGRGRLWSFPDLLGTRSPWPLHGTPSHTPAAGLSLQPLSPPRGQGVELTGPTL